VLSSGSTRDAVALGLFGGAMLRKAVGGRR
jgi:hypothetical protein